MTSKDQDTLYIDENATSGTSPTLALRTSEADTATDTPVAYEATDNDNTRNGNVDTVTYSVEGADEKYFTISDDTNSTLAFTAELRW